ncbi:MAG: aldo/keto reductase, partial [Bacteroidota bacterium]|nr:aldo/keto reductase [Bacteroidota bacterium]
FNAGETFSGIGFHEGLQLTKKIRALLPDNRFAQWALRWILDFPEVTTIIPGASKPAQVKSNIGASALPPLSATLHHQLRDLYDDEIKSSIRGRY